MYSASKFNVTILFCFQCHSTTLRCSIVYHDRKLIQLRTIYLKRCFVSNIYIVYIGPRCPPKKSDHRSQPFIQNKSVLTRELLLISRKLLIFTEKFLSRAHCPLELWLFGCSWSKYVSHKIFLQVHISMEFQVHNCGSEH